MSIGSWFLEKAASLAGQALEAAVSNASSLWRHSPPEPPPLHLHPDLIICCLARNAIKALVQSFDAYKPYMENSLFKATPVWQISIGPVDVKTDGFQRSIKKRIFDGTYDRDVINLIKKSIRRAVRWRLDPEYLSQLPGKEQEAIRNIFKLAIDSLDLMIQAYLPETDRDKPIFKQLERYKTIIENGLKGIMTLKTDKSLTAKVKSLWKAEQYWSFNADLEGAKQSRMKEIELKNQETQLCRAIRETEEALKAKQSQLEQLLQEEERSTLEQVIKDMENSLDADKSKLQTCQLKLKRLKAIADPSFYKSKILRTRQTLEEFNRKFQNLIKQEREESANQATKF